MNGEHQEDQDKRVSVPLDPEDFLRGLLEVDPDDPPADEAEDSDA